MCVCVCVCVLNRPVFVLTVQYAELAVLVAAVMEPMSGFKGCLKV